MKGFVFVAGMKKRGSRPGKKGELGLGRGGMESGSSPRLIHHPRKALEPLPFPLQGFPMGFVFTGQRRSKTWLRGKGEDCFILALSDLCFILALSYLWFILPLKGLWGLGSSPGVQQGIPREPRSCKRLEVLGREILEGFGRQNPSPG